LFVVFDFDGVIIDSMPAVEAAVKAVHQFLGLDHPTEREVAAWMGPPIDHSAYRLQRELGLDDATTKQVGATYFNTLADLSPDMIEPFDGILKVLDALAAQHVPYALATMKTHAEMNAMSRPLKSLDRFEHILAPDTPSDSLTKGDLVRDAVALLQDKYNATAPGFMVGDRTSDLVAGRESQLLTVGVTWGAGTKEELLSESPNYVVNTPAELGRLFEDSLTVVH
jgi:phosphoglycolate phosphatase-like HAD superfamily hydrolase